MMTRTSLIALVVLIGASLAQGEDLNLNAERLGDSNAIRLSWSQPTTIPPDQVDHYLVQRKAFPTGTWTTLRYTAGTPDTTVFLDRLNEIPNSITYQYQVLAYADGTVVGHGESSMPLPPSAGNPFYYEDFDENRLDPSIWRPDSPASLKLLNGILVLEPADPTKKIEVKKVKLNVNLDFTGGLQIIARVRIDQSAGNAPLPDGPLAGIGLDAGPGSSPGFFMGFWGDGTTRKMEPRLWVVSGTPPEFMKVDIGTAPQGWDVGSWYWFKLRIDGQTGQAEGWAWPDGEPLPHDSRAQWVGSIPIRDPDSKIQDVSGTPVLAGFKPIGVSFGEMMVEGIPSSKKSVQKETAPSAPENEQLTGQFEAMPHAESNPEAESLLPEKPIAQVVFHPGQSFDQPPRVVPITDLLPDGREPSTDEGTYKFASHFPKPAYFPLTGYGPRGQVLDPLGCPIESEGVVIHEGMSLLYDRDGRYLVRFTVTSVAMPVLLRLQLRLSTPGPNRPDPNPVVMTLPPVSIPLPAQGQDLATPHSWIVTHTGFSLALARKVCAALPTTSPLMEGDGLPPLGAATIRDQPFKVSRDGVARFGSGVPPTAIGYR